MARSRRPNNQRNKSILSTRAHDKSQGKTRGSNVSGFERAFTDLIIEKNPLVRKEIIENLQNTPERMRPLLFRINLDEKTLIGLCAQLKIEISRIIKIPVEKLSLSATSNNKDGSDLLEKNSNTRIELKLGAPTDINIGLKAIKYILGEEVLEAFPDRKWRAEQRAKFDPNMPKSIQELVNSHNNKLAKVVDLLNGKQNAALGKNGQKILNRYALGITSLDEIMNDSNNNLKKVERFILSKDMLFKHVENNIHPTDSQWVFHGAVKAPSNNLLVPDRLHLKFVNNASRLRLIYNYKNTARWKSSDGANKRAPAYLGLGTPSFNGWWEKIDMMHIPNVSKKDDTENLFDLIDYILRDR